MEQNSVMPQNGVARNHLVYCTTLLPRVNMSIALLLLAAKNETNFKEKKTKEHVLHWFKIKVFCYLQMILYNGMKAGNILLTLAPLIIKQNWDCFYAPKPVASNLAHLTHLSGLIQLLMLSVVAAKLCSRMRKLQSFWNSQFRHSLKFWAIIMQTMVHKNLI